MYIAIDSKLNSLANYLKTRGYNIIPLNSTNQQIDALVLADFPLWETSLDFDYPASTSQNGIFMVCAKNKSFEEIESILNNRSYSKIF